jgi:peptidoglycan/LPS O-acetylase OafA/YrhL
MAERNHAIDGLRALAAGLVVMHHAFSSVITGVLERAGIEQSGPLVRSFGASGVELFFCISGIVLLRPYLRRERQFSIGKYVIRRVERLWPPYLAALIFASAVVAFGSAVPTWFSAEILPPFRFVDAAAQVALFLPPGVPTYNGAWWSLSVEVVFYAAVPLIVIGFRRVIIPFAITAYILAELAWASAEAGHTSVLLLFVIYLPCFAVGILVAARDLLIPIWLVVTLGVGQFAAWFFLDANLHTAFAFLYLALILAVNRPGRLRRVFTAHLAVWFGERSYSFFLVHFSAFYLANNLTALFISGRTAGYVIIARAIGFPFMFVAAIFIFHFVERRFARGLVTAHEILPRLSPRPVKAALNSENSDPRPPVPLPAV